MHSSYFCQIVQMFLSPGNNKSVMGPIAISAAQACKFFKLSKFAVVAHYFITSIHHPLTHDKNMFLNCIKFVIKVFYYILPNIYYVYSIELVTLKKL